MIRISPFPTLAVLVAASTLPSDDVRAEEGEISPKTAFRDVTVIVSVLDGEESDSEGGPVTSEELGPFDDGWDLSVSLPVATAEGRATQTSDIGATGVTAEATLTTAISSVVGGAAATITSNQLQATFTVTGPVDYQLQGSIAAFGGATGTFWLFGEGIEHLYTASGDSIPFDVSGTLPDGSYVLLATVEADLTQELVDEGADASRGSFGFDLTVCPTTPAIRQSWGEVKDHFAGPPAAVPEQLSDGSR